MSYRDLEIMCKISRENAMISANPPEGMHRLGFWWQLIDVPPMVPSSSQVGLEFSDFMVRVVFRSGNGVQ